MNRSTPGLPLHHQLPKFTQTHIRRSSTLAWKIPWTEEPRKAAVHGVAEGWTRLSDFTSTFHFHALEKEMAAHSSVLAEARRGSQGASRAAPGKSGLHAPWEVP